MQALSRRRPPLALIVALVVALAIPALLPPAVARAEVRSLFGRSPAFANLNNEPLVTPDGRFVLFSADMEQDDVYNLYRAPLAGGDPVRLSGTVVAGRGVRRFDLSPDGARVVYIAAQDVDGREELYSVPLEGGQPVKLNAPLPTGGNVRSFRIDPGGAVVVYYGDQQTNEVFELFKAPIAGGAPVRLNGPLPSGGDVADIYRVSANGQFAVYMADQDVDGRTELFSASLRNGSVQKLNGPLAQGGFVDFFALSPILNIATYVAKEGAAFELFAVQLNGNPIGKLSGALPADRRITSNQITPDGQRVVYTVGRSFGSDAENVAFSVAIFGGAPVRLSPPVLPGGDARVSGITADSRTALLSVRTRLDRPYDLYAASITSGDQTFLFRPEEGRSFAGITLSPDSAWAVFEDQGSPRSLIKAVPLAGGLAVTLSDGLGEAYRPRVGPSSDRVLFIGQEPDAPACPERNAFSAQIFGGGLRQLTDLCGTRVQLQAATWVGDGAEILIEINHRDANDEDAGFELLVSDGLPVERPAELPNRLLLPLLRG